MTVTGLDERAALQKMQASFPDFEDVRTPIYDDDGTDITTLCMDLDMFAYYAWDKAQSDRLIVSRAIGLIDDLFKNGSPLVADLVDTCFMEALNHAADADATPERIAVWAEEMSPALLALSPEWREKKRRLDTGVLRQSS